MSTSKYTKVSILVPRKKGMTEAEFHRHWANHHGPLVTSWLRRYGIIRYSQVHITPEHKAKGQALGSGPTFDGIAEFLIEEYDMMAKAYKDQEYFDKIRPDEEKFIDLENAVFSIGKELTVIDKNEAVPYGDTGY